MSNPPVHLASELSVRGLGCASSAQILFMCLDSVVSKATNLCFGTIVAFPICSLVIPPRFADESAGEVARARPGFVRAASGAVDFKRGERLRQRGRLRWVADDRGEVYTRKRRRGADRPSLVLSGRQTPRRSRWASTEIKQEKIACHAGSSGRPS